MKGKTKKILIGASFLTGIVAIFLAFIMVMSNVGNIIDNEPELEIKKKSFKPIVLSWLGDADPGGLASGVINGYVTYLAADYSDNLTAGEYYYVGDTNNTEIGTDVPWNVNHEIAVLVRWNTTHAYSGSWDMSLVRAYINCTDLSLSGQIAEEVQVSTNASFAWVFYWYDWADAGYDMDRGEDVNDVLWNFEYYG